MTNELFSVKGRKALVTGCSRGIGQAMAIGLAEAGADIIGVSASLKPESEVEQQVKATGRNFWGYTADLGNRDALYQFTKELKASHPVIDILINNDGTILRSPAAEHSDEAGDSVLPINLDAPFLLARQLGREMIARGHGKIVFTRSLLSFQGDITVPGYAVSKGALASLVKALANEWAAKGVNVNGIAPGIFLQTIPRPCGRTKHAARAYWTGYPPAGGESPMTSKAP